MTYQFWEHWLVERMYRDAEVLVRGRCRCRPRSLDRFAALYGTHAIDEPRLTLSDD